MGIFSAMNTAVSGIDAQSFALENISGNIANSQTIGYKRIDTSFVDLLRDTPLSSATIAGSVLARSQSTNTVQGTISKSAINTNIALDGPGYFVVGPGADIDTNGVVSSSGDLYTRRGDFTLDANGYLVNGAGFYLKGTTGTTATSGIAAGAISGAIHVSSDQLAAKATTTIDYRANLPSIPVTAAGGNGLMNPADFTTDPIASGTVTGADVATFVAETVPGGTMPVYAADGTAATLNLRWGKLSNGTWAAFVQTDSTATGAAVSWQRVGGDFTFNGSGQLTSANTINIPAMTIDGVALGPISFSTGTNGLTQYNDSSGQVNANLTLQDGYASGQLLKVSINDAGQVVGNYSNGKVLTLAQISVVQFNGDDGLQRLDGGVYAQTLESGQPLVGLAGSKLVTSSVETSNTDISSEFSKMIVTQQAYSANTKILSTAQQMLQDVLNIVR